MHTHSTSRRLLSCAAASLAAHALALATWSALSALSGAPGAPADEADADEEVEEELVHVDIEKPPEAPEAPAPQAANAPAPAPAPAPEPEPEPEPETHLDPVSEPRGGDAGTPSPDAGLASTDAGPAADAATPGSDAATAPADAGAPAADAAAYAQGSGFRDAGRAPLGKPRDGSPTPVATGPRDAGPGSAAAAAAGGDAGPLPAGAAADLAPYAPEGDVVTVLLRLDRIRDTPWEERVRAILEPMPDYRAILGESDIELAGHLDTLFITSSDPKSITATTLAAKSRERADTLRSLLDRERAPVTWSNVRGGLLGTRRPGPERHPSDPRVYLLPSAYDHWLVLARPEDMGQLLERGGGAAGEGDEPSWLAAIPNVEAEAGEEEEGPLAVVSARAFPRSVWLPRVGQIPAPRHAAMAVEIDPRGFRIRGTLSFDDEERARAFEDAATDALDELTGKAYGRLLLKQVHAYNAARGLSFHRAGRRVGYATSVSIADGRAALAFAADWSARYFGAPSESEAEEE